MSLRRPRQLLLPVPAGRGGRRHGAGRKPAGPRPGVRHAVRPYHDACHPAHVTLRAVSGLASLRAPGVFAAMRAAIARAQRGGVFRICHFSVQSNHVHMLIEARDRQALSRGIQGLAIRLARAINRVLARYGKVWTDRYHRHDLTSPREVRHALVYVLNNAKKHVRHFRGLDPYSSAAWFTGWRDHRPVTPSGAVTPVTPPRTWLLGAGWRRAGSIGMYDAPTSG